MNYGIIGSGDVAQTIGAKLISLGHEVMLGSRSASNETASKWAEANGERASHGTFEDAAKFGERIFLSAKGIRIIDIIESVGPDNFKGKLVVDQTNPYLYENGIISLDSKYSGATCLGEQVQKHLPDAKVVKTLNYLSVHLMTNPGSLPEPVTGFYCGNDPEAKAEVKALLHNFGWVDTLDLGDITMSRYTEMLGAFWPAGLNATDNMDWAFKFVRKG